jgi:hypothetical protein
VWWYTPVIPALGKLRKEDHEFEASLGYIARAVSKKKKKQGNRKDTQPQLVPMRVGSRMNS